MAASDDLDPGQILDVSHEDHAGVEFLATSFDPGHGGRGPQGARAGVDFAAYDTLRAWAEMLNDTQQTRIQIGNRIKANERRGITTPQLMQAEYEAIQDGEHRQELALRRQYRVTAPAAVREWQKTTPGIGEPLLARLLGHLGHPAIARPHHWEGAGTKRRSTATVGTLFAGRGGRG